MSGSLFSDLWYRVANVQPRLRGHTQITRHVYRGDVWYVIQDDISGRHHRFNRAAHFLIDKMDGSTSVQSIWESSIKALGPEAPSQDEVINLMGQLHGADLLASDVLPDSIELIERSEKMRKSKLKQKLMSPMAIRVPLFDPEPLLRRSVRFATPVFGLVGLLLWLFVVVSALVQAAQHGSELLGNVADTVMTPSNLLLLWLLFPLVKALHEFGHAYATKVWGGEVHEMGIMFLVFMPVPYVDASAASAFPQRSRRMVVGAAGMLVEVFVAALALHFWVLAEPGLSRTVAYNVVLIGSVSTLVFNANPLLRFDGYYIFCDWLEIPNLGARANRYLGYLLQKYLFKVRNATSPVTAGGERLWFVLYSTTSFVYRTFVMTVIAMFVASKYFFIGVLLAIMAVANMFVIPLFKQAVFLMNSPKLQHIRVRAVSLTAVIVTSLLVILFLLPAPHWTNAEGVVWMPEQSRIRAGADCFVYKVLVDDGARVSQNSPLLQCQDLELNTQLEILEARVSELQIEYVYQRRSNQVAAELLAGEIEAAVADLERARELFQAQTVMSPAAGRVSIPLFQDLPGRFFRKGEEIGYVIHPDLLMVRAAVVQDDIALVRNKITQVEVRFSDRPADVLEAKIVREVPGASHRLPSEALGHTGGGSIAVDPRAGDGLTAFDKVFQFDLEVDSTESAEIYGGRVWVRFGHGAEPLGWQLLRSLRQLFLGAFGV
ncbi:MAG: HlyD family efflux transporter periplasmic adaptor subunit [Halioglobus sp.]